MFLIFSYCLYVLLCRGGNSDLPVARRGDACLVAPVADIKYKTSDLLILMYEHMLGAGLTESANALLKEARLQEALNTRRQQMTGRDVGVVAHRRGVNREISRAGQALSPQPPLTVKTKLQIIIFPFREV